LEIAYSRDNQAINCFIGDTKEIRRHLEQNYRSLKSRHYLDFYKIMAAKLKEDI